MEPDVSDVKTKMQVWRLSRLVANYPYAVLLAILLFSSTCLIVPLTTKQFPNFSDPQLVRTHFSVSLPCILKEIETKKLFICF